VGTLSLTLSMAVAPSNDGISTPTVLSGTGGTQRVVVTGSTYQAAELRDTTYTVGYTEPPVKATAVGTVWYRQVGGVAARAVCVASFSARERHATVTQSFLITTLVCLLQLDEPIVGGLASLGHECVVCQRARRVHHCRLCITDGHDNPPSRYRLQ
jgi:hypothetical protein